MTNGFALFRELHRLHAGPADGEPKLPFHTVAMLVDLFDLGTIAHRVQLESGGVRVFVIEPT